MKKIYRVSIGFSEECGEVIYFKSFDNAYKNVKNYYKDYCGWGADDYYDEYPKEEVVKELEDGGYYEFCDDDNIEVIYKSKNYRTED